MASDSDAQSKLQAIEAYVIGERLRRGITNLGTQSKPEISGESYGVDGEFVSLLERQLLTVEIGFGCWNELSNEDTLNGVWRVVRRRTS